VPLTSVSIEDFRNIQRADAVPLASGLTLVYGANAQGKTNFLEALALLLAGIGIRGQSERELVRQGATLYRLSGVWEDSSTAVPVTLLRAVSVQPIRRRREGPSVPVVVFSPDDLQIIKGGPAERRRFLDELAVQLYPRYGREARLYQRALIQRNRALKESAPPAVVQSFEAALAESGSYLWQRRLDVVSLIGPGVSKIAASLAPGEEANIALVRGGHAATDSPGALLDELARRRPEEFQRGMTLTGPHRDELAIVLNGQSAQQFSSQGQQRTLALTLRLAAREGLRVSLSRPPVVLLDDVLSELDGARREALLSLVAQAHQQTVVTDTAAEAYRDLAPWRLTVQGGHVEVAP
jgi:DNA replication and repair protein RecF